MKRYIKVQWCNTNSGDGCKITCPDHQRTNIINRNFSNKLNFPEVYCISKIKTMRKIKHTGAVS